MKIKHSIENRKRLTSDNIELGRSLVIFHPKGLGVVEELNVYITKDGNLAIRTPNGDSMLAIQVSNDTIEIRLKK